MFSLELTITFNALIDYYWKMEERLDELYKLEKEKLQYVSDSTKEARWVIERGVTGLVVLEMACYILLAVILTLLSSIRPVSVAPDRC